MSKYRPWKNSSSAFSLWLPYISILTCKELEYIHKIHSQLSEVNYNLSNHREKHIPVSTWLMEDKSIVLTFRRCFYWPNRAHGIRHKNPSLICYTTNTSKSNHSCSIIIWMLHFKLNNIFQKNQLTYCSLDEATLLCDKAIAKQQLFYINCLNSLGVSMCLCV